MTTHIATITAGSNPDNMHRAQPPVVTDNLGRTLIEGLRAAVFPALMWGHAEVKAGGKTSDEGRGARLEDL